MACLETLSLYGNLGWKDFGKGSILEDGMGLREGQIFDINTITIFTPFRMEDEQTIFSAFPGLSISFL